MPSNPIRYVEVPVTDLDRAATFYTAVFGYALERDVVDGYPTAYFPLIEGAVGASGALMQGDVYRPSHEGAVVYHQVDNLDRTLALAEGLGAAVLYRPKDLGDLGRVAEIEDSEGNRVALHQRAAPSTETV